jgi:Ca2+-binding RTX toxin-like protein
VVSALPDGGFEVAYADTSSGDSDIHVVTFDSTGAMNGNEVVANSETTGTQWYPTLTTLSDGRLVVGWQDEPGNDWNDPVNIRAQILDPMSQGGWGEPIHGTEGDDILTGTEFRDVINGSGGSDRLDGGLGADEMRGGAGDDSYVLSTRLDKVIETTDGGRDSIILGGSLLADGSFSLANYANVEELHFRGQAAGRLSGNALDNLIFGGMAADTIDGALGADEMMGFTGNDIYTVDNAGDRVTEIENGGFDTVRSSVSFTLGEHVEALVAVGTAAVALTGNGQANSLTGNAAANVLDGGEGADTLNGAAGIDTASYMMAVSGVTANLETPGTNSGAAVGDIYVEIENLTGSAFNDVLTGNAARNVLQGGFGGDHLNGGAGEDQLLGEAGADTLDGGAGADGLSGGLGDDTFLVDNASDLVSESAGGGLDTVLASSSHALAAGSEVEVLKLSGGSSRASYTLTGSDTANEITGHAGTNLLQGQGGDDVLQASLGNDQVHGGSGNDRLYGEAGRDVFMFGARLNKRTNVDKLYDFRSKDDSVWLENKVFTKLGSGTASKLKKFNSDMFVEGNKAQDREDRIVYDKKTGALYYDQDGTGSKAQVKIATLTNKTKLAYHDFFVI